MPAFFAVIRTVTMTDEFTLRNRMKMIWSRLTGALERMDCHHSQNALQMNPKIRIAMMAMMNRKMRLKSKDMPVCLLRSRGDVVRFRSLRELAWCAVHRRSGTRFGDFRIAPSRSDGRSASR